MQGNRGDGDNLKESGIGPQALGIEFGSSGLVTSSLTQSHLSASRLMDSHQDPFSLQRPARKMRAESLPLPSLSCPEYSV